MQYWVLEPSEKLRPYVSEYLILKDSNPTKNKNVFKVIADGIPGLVFQEIQNSVLNEKDKLPQAFLHGLTTFAKQKTISGSFTNIVVLFRPYAIKLIFGIDSNELANQYIDINDILKNTLSEQLLSYKEISEKIRIMEDFIWTQINQNKQDTNSLCTYLYHFLGKKHLSISDMQSDLNLSERTLERLFKQNVGISPKFYLRICRFQSAISSMRSVNHLSLTKIAYENQYADQSHFIREFKEFSGVTPRQFMRQTYGQNLSFFELE